MNTVMKSAMLATGIRPHMFRKFQGTVLPDTNTKPLVIQTNMKAVTDEHGCTKMVSARASIQKVAHVVGVGSNQKAVTEGGDVWPFRNQGNGFLVAQ